MSVGRIALEWVPADMWVGVFWRTTNCDTDTGRQRLATDVWICLVPCVPLHLTIWHKPKIVGV